MAVSAIPEGLPAVITICLATGVRRMAKNQAIARNLSAVETLGSVNLIASDKTGTLTYNQMALESIFISSGEISVTGKGYNPKGDFFHRKRKIDPSSDPVLTYLLKTGALVNDAQLQEKENRWEILGDPTEGALIVAAAKAGLHRADLEKEYERISEIPFQTERGFMATLNRDDKKENFIFVKGSPEKLLLESSHFLTSEGEEKFSNAKKEEFLKYVNKFAKNGLRVLAMAYKKTSPDVPKIEEGMVNNLCFVGIAGLADPPREEVLEVIPKCQKSGIRVVMITGDHPLTAQSIASQIGLSNHHFMIQGGDLDEMSDSRLESLIERTNVYARISPIQKLRLVRTFQKKGYVVAVTGDGVNDAPAIKQADVGVAMGISGTDVSREASDMVLVDDNFVSIVRAIEEGRTIFGNIRRVVMQLVGTSAGEILIIFGSLFLGFPIPLLPVQILWINLVTDGFVGIPLALEPKHPDVLRRKPYQKAEPIISSLIFFRIILVALVMMIGTLILYSQALGKGIEEARTVAFATMVVFQILNMFNSRSVKTSIFKMKFFENRWVVFAFCASLLFSLAVIYIPFLQPLFHMKPLPFSMWPIIFGISLSIIAAVEIEKLIRKLIRKKDKEI